MKKGTNVICECPHCGKKLKMYIAWESTEVQCCLCHKSFDLSKALNLSVVGTTK